MKSLPFVLLWFWSAALWPTDSFAQANPGTDTVLNGPAVSDTDHHSEGGSNGNSDENMPQDPQTVDIPDTDDDRHENANENNAESDASQFEIEVEYADDAISPTDSAVSPTDQANSRPTAVINFSGVLLEKGTRALLSDVTVYLKGTEFEATTDRTGTFNFRDLPAGHYTVVIPTTGFEKVETDEEIIEGKKTTVKYYLEPIIYSGLEVVVRDKKIEKEVSHQELSIEVAAKVAGTGGDPVRAIESMPGIARGAFSGGNQQPVMRGSNAETSKVFLDGHEIPMLFHFGELKSVYNGQLLKQFDIYNGGFSVQHGLATGGIVDIKTRTPRTDRWGGYADLSTLDASAMAEGPISNNLSMALAVRHSTIEYVFKAIQLDEQIDELSFTNYPSYWDYQSKFNYQTGKHHTLTLDTFGFHDEIAFRQHTVEDDDPTLTGDAEYDVDYHSAFVHWRFDNNVVESDFSPGYEYYDQKSFFGPYYFNMKWHGLDVREDLKFHLGKHNTLVVGAKVNPGTLTMTANMIRPPKEGDVSSSFSLNEPVLVDRDFTHVKAGGYVQDELQVGPVLLIPGVRFDYESSMKIFNVGPRAAVRWEVTKPLVLKASGGLYSRLPDGDEFLKPWGNDLEYEQAAHAVAGFEWQIVDGLDLDMQGYYKYLYDQVVTVQDASSDAIYDNSGTGVVFGGDLMLNYNVNERFTGWVSYSISKSMRDDGAGTPKRPFDLDQRHKLVVVSSYEFSKGWTLGAKFQYASGVPYTPGRSSIFNADDGTYLLSYDEEKNNSLTTAPYHRLDIRIDKKWLMNNWILHAYLDVQNVYNRKNPVDVDKNYDYSETVNVYDSPILPSFGVTAEF